MEETQPSSRVEPAEEGKWAHRLLDVFSLTAFTSLQAAGWLEVWGASDVGHAMLATLLGLTLGWLLSDASSGLLHFLADNYGHESWPLVGGAFIRPFREHHRDPLAILRHGFLERNGNNALIALVAFAWVPLLDWGGTPTQLIAATCLSWGAWTVVTNQIHAWAHAPSVPPWVRGAQRIGVLLSPEQHEQHHRPPYRSHYCITSGILDRILNSGRAS